jgi:hypothetical protein
MRKHYIGFCLFFLLAITGCKDPDKARAFIENATREAKILNAKYCAEENAHWREVFITAIRSQVPLYPDGGYCEIKQIVDNLLEVA